MTPRCPRWLPDAGGERAAARRPWGLVELVSEPLARLELGLLRGGDPDFLASARIAAFRGGAPGHREGPEPYETNLATPLQCTGDRLEHRFYRLIGGRLRQVSLTGNGIDQLVSIHVLPPKRDAGWLRTISVRECRATPWGGSTRCTNRNSAFFNCYRPLSCADINFWATRHRPAIYINALARLTALRSSRE